MEIPEQKDTIGFLQESEEYTVQEFGSMHKDLLVSIGLIGCFVIFLLLFAIFFFKGYHDYKVLIKKQCSSDVEEGRMEIARQCDMRTYAGGPFSRRQRILSMRSISKLASQPVLDQESVKELSEQSPPKFRSIDVTSSGVRSSEGRPQQPIHRTTAGSIQNFLKRLQSVRISSTHRPPRKPSRDVEATSGISLLLQDQTYTPIKIVQNSGSSEEISNLPTAGVHREIKFLPREKPPRTGGHLKGMSASTVTKRIYPIEVLEELGSKDRLSALLKLADEGSLLVSETIFPNRPIGEDLTFSEIDAQLKAIHHQLQVHFNDITLKRMMIMIFLSHSFGMQKYQNVRVFMRSYGILVKDIVDEGIAAQLYECSVILGTCLIEVLIKYCIACWKFDSSVHKSLDSQFLEWDMTPVVLNRTEVYTYLLKLLELGLKTEILLEILSHFTYPATPDILDLLRLKKKELIYMPELMQGITTLLHIAEDGVNSPAVYSSIKDSLKPQMFKDQSIRSRSLPGSLSVRIDNQKKPFQGKSLDRPVVGQQHID